MIGRQVIENFGMWILVPSLATSVSALFALTRSGTVIPPRRKGAYES
jgi:hypothetical protein